MLLPQLCPQDSPRCRAVRAPEGAGGPCQEPARALWCDGLSLSRSRFEPCGRSRRWAGAPGCGRWAVCPAHGAPRRQPVPGRGSGSWHCRLLPDPAGSSCPGSDWLKGKLYAFEGKQRLSELLSSEARSCPLRSPHNSRPAPPVRLS